MTTMEGMEERTLENEVNPNASRSSDKWFEDTGLIAIVGAQKCGTTSLFHALAKHPAISAPVLKEPHFFSLGTEVTRRRRHWYRSLFQIQQPNWVLDASTSYFTSLEALEAIRKSFSRVKIIVTVRDPAERSFSAYLHMALKDPPADSRSFETVVSRLLASPSARGDLFEREESAIQEAVRQGSIVKDYFGRSYLRENWAIPFESTFSDPMWVYRYFSNSCYSFFLENWLREFKDDVHVVILEKFQRKPDQVLDEIYSFLELNHISSERKEARQKNATRIPRGIVGNVFAALREKAQFVDRTIALFRRIGLDSTIRWLGTRLYHRPALSRDSYNLIRARLLADEYEYWFSRWPNLKMFWRYDEHLDDALKSGS